MSLRGGLAATLGILAVLGVASAASLGSFTAPAFTGQAFAHVACTATVDAEEEFAPGFYLPAIFSVDRVRLTDIDPGCAGAPIQVVLYEWDPLQPFSTATDFAFTTDVVPSPVPVELVLTHNLPASTSSPSHFVYEGRLAVTP